ncbi:MAG: S1C family serine protease [Spirochaetes bacterium]|nr:S1C family serine protease [Spirochaetota bacterium]
MTRRAAVRQPSARAAVVFLALAALVSCAGTRTPVRVPELPAVRLSEIERQIADGSVAEALQGLDYLRREKAADLPEGSLEQLQTSALAALGDAFGRAVSGATWTDALRLARSAAALSRPDLAPGWTEKSLLRELALQDESRGEMLAGLLTRLRAVTVGEPTASELAETLAAAVGAGNPAVARTVAGLMRSRGLEPGAVPDTRPSFGDMLKGTVTIWVNRGVKIENGVGYPDRVIGSGFFIDRRGYLLTNHHVIASEVDPGYEGFSRLYVRLSGDSTERIPARVVGWDPVFDLALVKVEVEPGYVFSGSAARNASPGDRIYAIGSPGGLESTITSGIVSATGRRFLQVGDAMQVDVPVNPGNSGGPLLDEKGDLAGIVFAGIEQFEGVNFAIPWYWVERALPLLYGGGEAVHPWLGMALSETDARLEVLYAMPGEPAAKAGVEVGDILESIDGRRVATLRDAQDTLLTLAPSTLVRLAVRRGGTTRDVLACLAPRPAEPVKTAFEHDAKDPVLYPLFGMLLERTGGVLGKGSYIVRRIVRGSVSDEAGLSVDDPLIVQDWKVEEKKGYATIQIVVKKKKAGFIESAIQVSAWLATDNFL